jgi:methylase of polypeptide subunit release factors
VLDIGVGEGVFTFAAHDRLVNLGASVSNAQHQIYGTEIYRPAYNAFIRQAAQFQLNFPNIHQANFFSTDFPAIDVALGNPPYVRRILIRNINGVRKKVLASSTTINEQELSRLTDLYIYFLLQASSLLREGGRLAVNYCRLLAKCKIRANLQKNS